MPPPDSPRPGSSLGTGQVDLAGALIAAEAPVTTRGADSQVAGSVMGAGQEDIPGPLIASQGPVVSGGMVMVSLRRLRRLGFR